jgi:hypothetical protein
MIVNSVCCRARGEGETGQLIAPTGTTWYHAVRACNQQPSRIRQENLGNAVQEIKPVSRPDIYD